MDQGKPVSRKHAVIGGVLGTLLVLALLAGLGWFGYTLFNQPIPTPSSASGDKGNSSNNPSRNPSAAQGREAARVRAAEKVPLADISDGKPNQKSARLDRGPSPVDLGKASDGPAAARLPEVVNLDGLNAGNPPPPRVAPVDLRGLAAGTKPSGVSPVNIGQDGGKAAVRLPAVVKLGDLNTGKPPPANLRPVDLGSMATESHVGGVPTANVGQASADPPAPRLPSVVKLDGLNTGKPPPANIRPVDLGSMATAGHTGGVPTANVGQAGADSSAPRLPNLVNLDGLAGGSAAKSPSMHPANVEASKGKGDFSAWQAAEQKSLDQQMAKLASDPDLMDAGEKARRFATCICRDLQGRLWLGCEPHSEDPHDGGAWCYDPSLPKDKQWKQYTAADGLGDNYVYAIACDKKGRIWVGQLNHGLSVYNGQKWQCYEVVGGLSRPDTLSGPIGERIFHITVDPSGNVWACTSAGLCEYVDASGTWRYIARVDGLPCDNCMSIAFDKAGNLYAATDCQGVAMANVADNYSKWRVVSGPMEEPATASGSGIPSNLCNDILVAGDGTVWLATDAGLAWSKDSGETWNYLRGKEWAAKVRGRLGGPPPGWSESASGGGAIPLSEDYCTCLAEDTAGRILVGHQNGYEAIDAREPDAARAALSSEKAYVSAILPAGGGEWVAAQGSGLMAEGRPTVTRSLSDSAPAAMPAACPPPTVAELNAYAAACGKSSPASQRADAAAQTVKPPFGRFEGDDWRTGGDWLGRLGRQYAVLFAADWPQDEWPTHGEILYKIQSCIGPNHLQQRDLLRRWMQNPNANDRRALYDCWVGHRVDAYADDHGEVCPASLDGPDIHVYVTLPVGLHRVSLYFNNGLRDFVIEMRLLPDKTPAPFHGKILPDGVPHPLLATARANQMRGGVYKSFLAVGPGRYDFIVRRNHSHNANCSAVMIDRLTGPDTYVDAWGLPEMGGHSYQAPPIPAPSGNCADSALRDAARCVWERASQAALPTTGNEWRAEILAYRAAVPAGDETDLMRNWRWHMRLWVNADRAEFTAAMAAGFKDFRRDLH